MSTATLFVYGSFADGEVHFKKISSFVQSMKPARAKGSVYRLEVGYPVFVADGNDWIPGQLVQLVDSDLVFPILDEFHGFSQRVPEKSLFHRITLEVQTEEGLVTTSVYALNTAKLSKTAQRIEDGNWKANIMTAQPLTATLTENQRKYISKLGASTGREIVPINLQLYRELMGKGLIVDKGRRLALTALGKEVYRYLGE